MKTRNFFKILGLSLAGLAIVKPKLKAEPLVIEFKPEVIVKPLDIQFEFTREGYLFRGFAIKNILIPCTDEEGNYQLETNSYGQFYRILCLVTKGELRLKLESEVMLKEDVLKCYKEVVEKMVNEALIRFKAEASLTGNPKITV